MEIFFAAIADGNSNTVAMRDGTKYQVRPSFVLPMMVARTEEVADALFLRKFGVPYWAIVRLFGRNMTFWYRLELSIGRNSIVGCVPHGRTELPLDDINRKMVAPLPILLAVRAEQRISARKCRRSNAQRVLHNERKFETPGRQVCKEMEVRPEQSLTF